MSTKTLHFAQTLARAFEQNRLFALAKHFRYPLAVYVHDGILVFGSPETLVEAIEQYRNTATAYGVTTVEPRVVAEGLPIDNTSNIWLELDHFDANGTCLRTSQMRLILRYTTAHVFPHIEMMDYTVTAFPELVEQFPLSRSA